MYLCPGVFNVKQKNRRRRRRTILDHPTQKMDDDEMIEFRTKVSPGCRLRHKTFTVMKKSIRSGATKSIADRFKFYAIAVMPFMPLFIELEGNPLSDRIYKHQIGAITCGPGWIFNLDVYDNAELKIKNEQGRYVDRIVNARKCGVGVGRWLAMIVGSKKIDTRNYWNFTNSIKNILDEVLTELCLLDSDINALDEQNRGKALLDDNGITLYTNCHKFVGLTMAAHSPGDGHVYLSSAIRIGYQRLLVYRGGLMAGEIGEEQEVDYNTYETRDAKQNFDSSTGDIGPCCGNDRCEAWMKNWYFCDLTPWKIEISDYQYFCHIFLWEWGAA